MFRNLFQSAKRTSQGKAAIPDGQRLYAIGDIHGRADLLDELLAVINADDASRSPAETGLIFLGDLIDRGPDSAGVVECLMDLRARRPETRFLAGNHEEVFLLALNGDVNALKFFARIGGRETISSYGITQAEFEEGDYHDLLRLVQARVPKSHLAFLESFEDLIVLGDYAFVHAGVRPSLPLATQKVTDLRWIREEFLEFDGTLEKVIVHGHTVSEEVEVRRHRIGIDTGAWMSGTLTAMAFEGSERWALQTAPSASRVAA